jgi:ubiquinone/menaquinone biosynthesis C-methylase UbiE
MTETAKEQPSQETLWAGKSGDRWLANIDGFEGMIKPIGDALIKQTAFSQGEQIIDIGCGAGATSLAIAQEVGASGSVTGLDISPVLVNEATQRAEKLKLENIQFMLGDAAVANLPVLLQIK